MKFRGKIGFSRPIEPKPGVSTHEIEERSYKGDILKDYRKWDGAETLNDDLSINNTISVVADPYLRSHFHDIKYVKWNKGCWKVNSVNFMHPRIEIHLGGVYNGPRKETT